MIWTLSSRVRCMKQPVMLTSEHLYGDTACWNLLHWAICCIFTDCYAGFCTCRHVCFTRWIPQCHIPVQHLGKNVYTFHGRFGFFWDSSQTPGYKASAALFNASQSSVFGPYHSHHIISGRGNHVLYNNPTVTGERADIRCRQPEMRIGVQWP